MSRIARIDLPDVGAGERLPALDPSEYVARLDATLERMRRAGLDLLVVYGDREHSANLAFLTGLDPRFEEAVLLLDTAGRRRLLVGNECLGYLPDPALHCAVELFQELSLMGQPRDRSRPLATILADFGIGRGRSVGCAGWKYFGDALIAGGPHALDIPSYLADTIRDLTGDERRVSNAAPIFMNPHDGLRTVNSVDQIARFEFAATRTSDSIRSLVFHLRDGVREADLERYLDGGGLPRSCHAMIGFGEKARRGLASPSSRRAARGDAYTAAYGARGALTCRAGAVAARLEDLPRDLRAFYPRFVGNYFDAVAAWYRTVRVGALAGEVFAAVESARDPALWHRAVNPGHLIHLDEWVHSPFSAGNRTVLRSGMALQMDIIPVSDGPFCAANVEDGIVLADEALRQAIAGRHPEVARRIEARRAFMSGALGIRLDPSVLPLSNIPGWLPPCALTPRLALCAEPIG